MADAGQTSNCEQSFLQRLRESVERGEFLRLTLGRPRRSAELHRVVITPLNAKSGHALSFRLQFERREETRNCNVTEAIERVRELIPATFLAATIFTKEENVSLKYSRKQVPALHASKPTLPPVQHRPHNREKHYLVRETAPFLQHLDIANAQQKVRATRYDKFRQINKFLELIDSLFRESDLGDRTTIRAIDYGSGKNYLTFAIYDYLANQRGITASVTGIEARPELVDHGNRAAKACEFKNLHFQRGEILTSPAIAADIVVALHACDTATDDAIAQAIRMKASLIALAPCCQKHVRARLQLPRDMYPIFKYGIMKERLAEAVTNGLRALVLEAYGYRTKVLEFIGGEHTAKNVMIAGVSRRVESSPRMEKVEVINSIREKFGLPDFYLDKVLSL